MEEQKSTNFFKFEDLRVYHKSLDYNVWLLEQMRIADEFSRKSLLTPFIDSATRVSTTIAEGTSAHKSEFVDYLRNAKSFVRECVVFTHTAQRSGIFTPEQAQQSLEMLMELIKMLGAMVSSLLKNNGSYSRRREQNYENNSNEFTPSDNAGASSEGDDFSFSY